MTEKDIIDLAYEKYPVIMTTLLPVHDDLPEIHQDCNRYIREAFVRGAKAILENAVNGTLVTDENGNSRLYKSEPGVINMGEYLSFHRQFQENRTKKVKILIYEENEVLG